MQTVGYIWTLRGFNYVNTVKREKSCQSTKSLFEPLILIQKEPRLVNFKGKYSNRKNRVRE